jgi:hypothetical protein
MRSRLFTVTAVLALLPFGGPAYATTSDPGPGPACGLYDDDYLTGGPMLLEDDSGAPGSGTLVCTVQVGESTHVGTDIAAASAHGTGHVYVPPTEVSFDQPRGVTVYVCTAYVDDDGVTWLYYNDSNDPTIEGSWSTDSNAACRLTIELEPVPLLPPQCDDGIDNDGDGYVDYPNDSNCSSPSDTTELGVPPTWAPVECSDGTDNDGDGWIDGSDGDCDGPLDTSESSSPPPPGGCSSVSGVDVCASLTPTTVQGVYDVAPAGTAGMHVAGSVERYEFTVNDATVTIACVVIDDPATPDACAAAGGERAGTLLTLYDGPVPVPAATPASPLARITVCNATLVLTVEGLGVNAAPAYTVC